jgi:hypothetical protein
MSSKLNKKHAKKKAKQQLNEEQQKAVKYFFKNEVEGLPLESLSDEEQEIVDKIRHDEQITTDEYHTIKGILSEYRKANAKYKPNETIKNYKKTEELVKSEKDFLNLIKNQEEDLIIMDFPYKGTTIPLSLRILPINDSRAIESINENMELMKQFNQKEQLTYDKAQRGETLSPEEIKVIENINKQLQKANDEGTLTIKEVNTLLAETVEFEKSDLKNKKEKIDFWEKVLFMPKMQLYGEVRNRLGLTQDANNKIFHYQQ